MTATLDACPGCGGLRTGYRVEPGKRGAPAGYASAPCGCPVDAASTAALRAAALRVLRTPLAARP